jgi:hypothetical protein
MKREARGFGGIVFSAKCQCAILYEFAPGPLSDA